MNLGKLFRGILNLFIIFSFHKTESVTVPLQRGIFLSSTHIEQTNLQPGLCPVRLQGGCRWSDFLVLIKSCSSKFWSNSFVYLLIIYRHFYSIDLFWFPSGLTIKYSSARGASASSPGNSCFFIYRTWVGICSWKLTCLLVSRRRSLMPFWTKCSYFFPPPSFPATLFLKA